jgi:hypothetical protein
MRISSPAVLLTVIATLALPATAHAQLIFTTSGEPDYTSEYEGQTYPVGEYADAGNASNSELVTMAGDVFTPTVGGTATNITFNGTYYDASATTDNFTLSLYSVSANTPSELLATTTLDSTRTVDPNSPSGYTFYNYSGSLNTPITLQANTTYYLGISNATNTYANWLVSTNSENPSDVSVYYYDSANDTFYGDSGQVLFTLSAPEPSSWAMLLVGLGLISYWRLRRMRA